MGSPNRPRRRPDSGPASTVLLAVVAALLALAPAAGAARPAEPLPLHATRGADPGIFDSRGREVLLRGVNVNQLGDYFQGNERFATVVKLRKRDFSRIARLGFNSVRLVLSWSRLEPKRGAFNRAYVRRIDRAVGWARTHGLHVVLDMHQDAWGKRIATLPGESCPPGSEPAIGWDGAPGWATITDGLSTCRLGGLRELSPAVTRAWRSLWEDRRGIQARLVRTWAALARHFAAEPAVAGYDLLNEPNPGLLDGRSGAADMGRFYGRAIRAIRRAESRRRRGLEHIVFFEPPVTWSAASTSAVPPADFTADENIVFSPHIYAESISPVPIGTAFELAREAAATYGVTVYSGEWGYFGDPDEQAEEIGRYAAAEDAHLYGGAWWSWRQACGDPHVIGDPGGEPDPLSPSLIRYACPSERALGIPEPFGRVLARPTLRAAPKGLASLRSSARERKLTASGGTAAADRRRCGVRAFVGRKGPGGSRARPRVGGRGVSGVRIRRVLGDWSVRACVEGSWELRIAARGRGR